MVDMTLDEAKTLVLWAQQNGLRAMKIKIKGLDLDVVFKEEALPAQSATDLSDIPHTEFKEGESAAKPENEEDYFDDELYAAADVE